MNNRLKRSAVILIALALFGLLTTSVFAQADGALVRFVHAIAEAPAVDIYTDGQLTIQNLDYGQASGYVNVPAGDHQLTVTATGDTTPLFEQTVSPTAGASLTLVAAPSNPPTFLVYQDDLSALALGKARFTAIHVVPEAPAVNLALADGQVAVSNLQFGQPAGSLDLPVAYDYNFVVTPADATDALLTLEPLTFASGTSYVLVVYGTADALSTLVLSAPTQAEGDSGLVRLVNGSATAVNVYLNDTAVTQKLALGQATGHLALPAGDYTVALKDAESNEDVGEGTLTVASGEAQTAVISSDGETLTLTAAADDVSGLDATQARLSLTNGISGAELKASLEDGTELTEAVTNIAPSTQAITLEVTVDGTTNTVEVPAVSFYGGVYYNLVAVDNEGTAQLVVAPTELAQGIASAPGAANAVLVVEATPELVVVEATVAPPPQATAAPAGEMTARPLVNPGVNLQLRQYPDPNALSLGLAPSDATLIVNGRAGAPVFAEGSAEATKTAEFVDPAASLEKDQDLVPEETWLNVTYQTPDGGAISAWVNAQFLSVSDAAGQPARLANLPLVPMNKAGEAVNTGVTPPPIPVDRVVATVFNLDPGVNLNIRRTPSVDGEVLVRITNGTAMELLGVLEARDWAFVRYSPAEGGSVTGWVNTLYIQYTLNGKPIDYEGMEAEELLVIADGTERGEVGAAIAPVERPTADPLKDAYVADVVLDPGSNLNLRRDPSPNAEVLVQIPSGSRLIVIERTEDGTWLHVTFEGADGWIAAKTDTAVFVRLTRNGKAVALEEIVVAGQPDASGTPQATSVPRGTPGATPTELPKMKVVADVVAMTVDPGGNQGELPVLTAGRIVILLYTDGVFSAIEVPEAGARGWVPASALAPIPPQ